MVTSIPTDEWPFETAPIVKRMWGNERKEDERIPLRNGVNMGVFLRDS